MDNGQLVYEDQGFIYLNGKVGGHKVVVRFYANALYVFTGNYARDIGLAVGFGATGALIGKAIDETTGGAGAQGDPEFAVAFADIQSVSIHKSLLNGAGILFTLHNGATFKIATPKMSMGGVKKIYPVIAGAVKAANPNVALDLGA